MATGLACVGREGHKDNDRHRKHPTGVWHNQGSSIHIRISESSPGSSDTGAQWNGGQSSEQWARILLWRNLVHVGNKSIAITEESEFGGKHGPN